MPANQLANHLLRKLAEFVNVRNFISQNIGKSTQVWSKKSNAIKEGCFITVVARSNYFS